MIKPLYKAIKAYLNNRFDATAVKAVNTILGANLLMLVDIGAAGEIDPRWKPFSNRIRYIGFEPDERSRLKLLSKGAECGDYQIYPFALSDALKSVPLYLCQKPEVSSLYKPNMDLLVNFPDSDRFHVVSEDTMDAVTLDL